MSFVINAIEEGKARVSQKEMTRGKIDKNSTYPPSKPVFESLMKFSTTDHYQFVSGVK